MSKNQLIRVIGGSAKRVFEFQDGTVVCTEMKQVNDLENG